MRRTPVSLPRARNRSTALSARSQLSKEYSVSDPRATTRRASAASAAASSAGRPDPATSISSSRASRSSPQDVGREKHRRPPRVEFENRLPNLPPTDRIEPAHRLVQDDQRRLVDNRLRDAEALAHAFREFAQADVPRPPEADEVEQPVDALPAPLPRQIAEGAVEGEGFPRRQVFVEIGILRHEPDLPPAFHVRRRNAENRRAAGGLPLEADEDLDRRRLPRPVRAEEAVDLPLPHPEVEAVQGEAPPLPEILLVRMAQARCFDCGKGFAAHGIRRSVPFRRTRNFASSFAAFSTSFSDTISAGECM